MIETIIFKDLLRLTADKEGFVALNTSRHTNKWVAGLPEELWESIYEVKTGDRVDLAFVFRPDAKYDHAKLALWRNHFGDAPRLEDYKADHAEEFGIDEEELEQFENAQGEKEEIYRNDRYQATNKDAANWLLNIPMKFLERYFYSRTTPEEIVSIRHELINTLEGFEAQLEQIGVDPSEVKELESEFETVATPQQMDRALEDLYKFGKDHGVWFESTLMKGSAVTASRVYKRLVDGWNRIVEPDWSPKMDKSLNTVVIEFYDGRTENVLTEEQLDEFLEEQFSYNDMNAGKGFKVFKRMSYQDYQVAVNEMIDEIFPGHNIGSSVLDNLWRDGYKIATVTLYNRVWYDKCAPDLNQPSSFVEPKIVGMNRYYEVVQALDQMNTAIGHSVLNCFSDLILFKKSNAVGRKAHDQDSDTVSSLDLILLNKTVEALNSRGLSVKVEDYIDWLTGNVTKGSSRFDQAIKLFLTEPVYNTFKHLNLVDAKVKFELGLGPPTVDGIDVSMSPEKESLQLLPGFTDATVEPPVVITR
jgi:hypothetical protein